MHQKSYTVFPLHQFSIHIGFAKRITFLATKLLCFSQFKAILNELKQIYLCWFKYVSFFSEFENSGDVSTAMLFNLLLSSFCRNPHESNNTSHNHFVECVTLLFIADPLKCGMNKNWSFRYRITLLIPTREREFEWPLNISLANYLVVKFDVKCLLIGS